MVVGTGVKWSVRGLALVCLLLAAGAGTSAAAEQLGAERRSALTALHRDLVAARDVWSALQMESFARARGLALPPMLGASRIIGDPLFAFPMSIDRCWEGSDWTVVWASDRLYFLGLDGCPLAPSHLLGRAPMRVGLSRDGRHICTIDHAEHGPWRLAGTRLSDGAATLRAEIPAQDGDFYASEPLLSDDGGSTMFFVLRRAPPDGHDEFRTIVVSPGGVQVIGAALGELGLGPAGAWAAVWSQDLKRSELRTQGRIKPFLKIACGGGAAAGGDEDGVHVVRPDGSLVDLPAPFPLGKNPDLQSVGDWLVIGADVAEGAQVAFYRWSEIAADPRAPPVRVVEGRCSATNRDPHALWLFRGRDYAIVDCSGATLRITPLGVAAETIQMINDEFDRCLVRYAGGVLICDPAGAELWRGACNGWYLITRDLLVIRRDRDAQAPHQLVRLARDPRERAELPLPLDKRAWRLLYDHTHDIISAHCDHAWERIDPRSGRVVPHAETDEPPFESITERAGRRVVAAARLRARGPAPERVEVRLLCADAWQDAGTTTIIGASGHLLTFDANGQWGDHGSFASAMRLGIDSRGRLALAEHGMVYLGSIVPTGARLTLVKDATVMMDDLPAGDWQVQRDGTYTPPGGRALRWDETVISHPLTLRAPTRGALLAVTASAILALTPAAATQLGRPVETR